MKTNAAKIIARDARKNKEARAVRVKTEAAEFVNANELLK